MFSRLQLSQLLVLHDGHLLVLRAAATAGGAGLGMDSVGGCGVIVSTQHAVHLQFVVTSL